MSDSKGLVGKAASLLPEAIKEKIMPQNEVSAPVDEGTASIITPPEGPTDTGALTEQPGQKAGSAEEAPAPEEPAQASGGKLPDSVLAPGASVIQD